MSHEDTNTNSLENPHGNIVNGDSQCLKPWNKPILFKKRGCEGKESLFTEITIEDGTDWGVGS